MKTIGPLLLLFGITAVIGNPKNDNIPGPDKHVQTMISYKMRISHAGGVVDITDTMLVKDNFVLEPIKIVYSEGTTNLSTGVTTNAPTRLKLQSYYFTDFSKQVGISFDVEKEVSAKTIKPYEIKKGISKMGYPLLIEPFLNSGVKLEELSKGKDTVINGRQLVLVKTLKPILVNQAGVADEVESYRITIDPALKAYGFPFISKQITERFGGGAVTLMESRLKNGMYVSMSFSYRDFTLDNTKLFDKYEALYLANSSVLESLKR